MHFCFTPRTGRKEHDMKISADTTRNFSIMLDCNKETEMGKISRLATNFNHPIRIIRKSAGHFCINPEKYLLLEIGGNWYRVMKKCRTTSWKEDGSIDKVDFQLEIVKSKITDADLLQKQIIEVPQKPYGDLHTYEGTYTRKGVPVMWEEGGGYTNKGYAILIANDKYRKKKPVYIKRSGHRASAKQALIAIRPGHIICQDTRYRGEHRTIFSRISEIEKLDDERCKVIAEEINSFDNETWKCVPAKELLKMAEAAWDKSETYHNREAVWIRRVE